MIITPQNCKVFAAKYYDNPFCLNESEFNSDLFRSSTIKKLITTYSKNDLTNIRLLVNTVISFFNVFEHHAATSIIKFKLSVDQYPIINSLLMFLSLPMIDDYGYDSELFIKLREEYR